MLAAVDWLRGGCMACNQARYGAHWSFVAASGATGW